MVRTKKFLKLWKLKQLQINSIRQQQNSQQEPSYQDNLCAGKQALWHQRQIEYTKSKPRQAKNQITRLQLKTTCFAQPQRIVWFEQHETEVTDAYHRLKQNSKHENSDQLHSAPYRDIKPYRLADVLQMFANGIGSEGLKLEIGSVVHGILHDDEPVYRLFNTYESHQQASNDGSGSDGHRLQHTVCIAVCKYVDARNETACNAAILHMRHAQQILPDRIDRKSLFLGYACIGGGVCAELMALRSISQSQLQAFAYFCAALLAFYKGAIFLADARSCSLPLSKSEHRANFIHQCVRRGLATDNLNLGNFGLVVQ